MNRRVMVCGVAVLTGAGALAVMGDAGASRADRVAAAERTVWDRYASLPADVHAVPDEPSAIAAMIAHHQDAIDGARAFLARADPDSTVAHFAERIIRVQTDQVVTMSRWLAEWYPDARPHADWSPMFADPVSTATPEAFLTVMIAHHEHAITMYASWVAAGIVTHDQLGILASRIAKGQAGEIARMHQFLGSPVSP